MARDAHKPRPPVCHPRERAAFHHIALVRRSPRIFESARRAPLEHGGIPALLGKRFAKLRMPILLTADRLPRTPAPDACTVPPSKNISAEVRQTRLQRRENQRNRLEKLSRALGQPLFGQHPHLSLKLVDAAAEFVD